MDTDTGEMMEETYAQNNNIMEKKRDTRLFFPHSLEFNSINPTMKLLGLEYEHIMPSTQGNYTDDIYYNFLKYVRSKDVVCTEQKRLAINNCICSLQPSILI